MNTRQLAIALRIALFVPFVSVVGLGCAAEQEEDTANAEGQVNTSEPLTLFEEHNGGRFDVREGQDVNLHLPVVTDQSWEVVDSGGLEPPMFTAKFGGAGGVIMTWKAKNENATVKLALKKGKKELRTFSFTLTVASAKVTCPPKRTINCAPKTSGTLPAECARDKREALEKQCGVNFVF